MATTQSQAIDSAKPPTSIPRLSIESLETRIVLSTVFQAPSFGAAKQPIDVIDADINGDGRPDLVTADTGNNSFSILINSADGGFAQNSSFATGHTFLRAVVAGDFNRDGHTDIATASNGVVSVFLAKPPITLGLLAFADPVDYLVGEMAFDIVAADFDGDGWLDLATADVNSSTVSVLYGVPASLGVPAGTFTIATKYPVSQLARSIASADVNGDGLSDLVVGRPVGTSVSLFIARAGRHFADPVEVSSGLDCNPNGVTLADFNLDGKTDIATANEPATPYATLGLSVMLGHGEGTFDPARTFATPLASNVKVDAADFDGDGNLDLAVMADIADVAVFLGSKRGDFTYAQRLNTPFALDFVADDLDGDGHADLATGNFQSTGVTVQYSARGFLVGTEVFGEQPDIGGLGQQDATVTGDFNEDGRMDIAVASYGDHNQYLGVRLGVRGSQFNSLPRMAIGDATTMVAGDVNRDGHVDIILTASTSVGVLLGYGNGSFRSEVDYSVGSYPFGVAVGDVDGDRWPDIVTANFGSSNMSILTNSEDGTFGQRADIPLAERGSHVAIGDVTNDGNTDIVVTTFSLGYLNPGSVSVFAGDGHGSFSNFMRFDAGGAPDAVVLSDLNKDNKLDIAVVADQSNVVGVNSSTIIGTLSPTQFYPSSAGSNRLSVADFDGDGSLDLATTGYSGARAILRNNGDGTFADPENYNLGNAIRDSDVADFDNDGTPDLATIAQVGQLYLTYNLSGARGTRPTVTSSLFDFPTLSCSFTFDQPINPRSIAPNILSIINKTTGATATPQIVPMLSSDRRTLRFMLPSGLSDGQYQFRLLPGAIVAVNGLTTDRPTNAAGNNLFILAGDINHDRIVDFNDLLILAQNFNTLGKTFGQGNLDYSADGSVDFNDLLVLAKAFGGSLPLPVATTASATPTRSTKRTSTAADVVA